MRIILEMVCGTFFWVTFNILNYFICVPKITSLSFLFPFIIIFFHLFSSLRKDGSTCLIGDPKVVRSHLLDFLSPLGHHHPVAFLSAVGIAWQVRTIMHRGRFDIKPIDKAFILKMIAKSPRLFTLN